MSDAARPAWIDEQLAGSTPYTQVLLRTAMADRLLGLGRVPDLGADAKYFDAAADFDADEYFDAGFQVVEASARLLDVSNVQESAEPSGADVLGAFGQSQRGTVWIEVDNGDGAMGRMIGQEYLLLQDAYVEFTFPGLDPANVLRKFSGRVMRFELTRRVLRVEVETL